MEVIGYEAEPATLDAVFGALADPTRRAILRRLTDGDASVGELAAPFQMSQPAISKHLKVLERAQLIERDVDRQRRPARLRPQTLGLAVAWLQTFQKFWAASFDELDDLLADLQQKEAEGDTE